MQAISEVYEFAFRGQMIDVECFEGLEVVRLNQTRLNGRVHVVIEINRSHGWAEFKTHIDTWNRKFLSRHVEPEDVRVWRSYAEYAQKNKTPVIVSSSPPPADASSKLDVLRKQIDDLQQKLEIAVTDNETLKSALRTTQHSLQEARGLHGSACEQLVESGRKLGRAETELQRANEFIKRAKIQVF